MLKIPKNRSLNLSNLLRTTIVIIVPTNDVALPNVAYVLYRTPSQLNARRVKLYGIKYAKNYKISVARP